MSRGVFSGEPLPLQPSLDDLKGLENPPNLGRFHFKLIEYLRRLGAKLDAAFNDSQTPIKTLVVFMSPGNPINRSSGEPGGGYRTMPFSPGLVIWNDSPYTVNVDGSVKIKEKGLYLVSVDTEITSFGNPIPFAGVPYVELRVLLERSGVGRVVVFSYTALTDVVDTETISMTVCISIPADFNLRPQARTSESLLNGVEFTGRGTRMQILQLATDDGDGQKCSGAMCGGWGGPGSPPWPPWVGTEKIVNF